MSVTIPAADLSRLVRAVSPVVIRRNTIPILGGICLEAADGRVTARATDMDVDLVAEAPADTNGTRIAHVLWSGTSLPRVLTAARADVVRLDLAEAGEGSPAVTLDAGAVSASLSTIGPAVDMPSMPSPACDGNASLTATLGDEALRAIAAVAPAMSREDTRYYLNGVCLRRGIGPWGWMVAATDGHRLMMADLPLPDAIGELPEAIIIPRRAVELMLRLPRGTDPLRLRVGTRRGPETGAGLAARSPSVTPDMIELGGPGLTMRAKLIDGTYPAFERVIPDTAAAVPVTVDRAALLRAIRIASALVAGERFERVGLRLDVADGTLTLSRETAMRDRLRQALEVEHAGPPLTIGLNGRYLADVLKAFGGSDSVTLMITDASDAVLLRADAMPGLQAVLMPMRL